MKLRKRYLPVAAVLGAAVAIVPAPALAAAPSEAKLEVNENCVDPDWPCWATPGSSQPAFKVTIASGGSVMFVDDKTATNIAWAGTAPACEPAVPVTPAAAKTGWEGKCTFSQPGTYNFESSTLFNEGGSLNYTKYEVVVEGSTTPSPGTTGESGSKGTPAPGGGTSSPTPSGGEAPSGSPQSTEKATKPLTRAQKLATALKQCKKQPKKKRAQCETKARKLYAPQHKSHKK